MHLLDLDMPQGTPEREPKALTDDQEKLVHELLDLDYDWNSAIVRLTIDHDTGVVSFTRLETYKRHPND